MEKTLTVNVDYFNETGWEMDADHIKDIDNRWERKSILNQIIKLISVSGNYDKIIFTYDTRMVFLFYGISLLYPTIRKKEIIFITLLVDINQWSNKYSFSFKSIMKYWFYYFFVRIPKKIIVHTNKEIQLYTETFKLKSTEKFYFIPHCFAYNLPNESDINYDLLDNEYIICAGNHRDIDIFVNTLLSLPDKSGLVIAGEDDRKKWEHFKADNIQFKFNVPYTEYRKLIANAKLLVFPVRKSGPLRSLGQITVLHGVVFDIPVLSADTFHLKDYFSKEEIWYYETGIKNSLSDSIELIFSNKSLTELKAKKAFERYKKNYTIKKYLDDIVRLCTV